MASDGSVRTRPGAAHAGTTLLGFRPVPMRGPGLSTWQNHVGPGRQGRDVVGRHAESDLMYVPPSHLFLPPPTLTFFYVLWWRVGGRDRAGRTYLCWLNVD